MDDSRTTLASLAKAAVDTSRSVFDAAFPTLTQRVSEAVSQIPVAGRVTFGTRTKEEGEILAAEAARRAAERRAEKQAAREELARLTQQHNLSFQHVLPVEGATHGMTVAYSVHKKNVVRFSIALCNPLDQFSRREGDIAAARKFHRGKYTEIHVPHYANVKLFMQDWMQASLCLGSPRTFKD